MFAGQLLYTGSLVLCYLLYFVHLLTCEEAKKAFPLQHVGQLLPARAAGQVASP